MVRTTCIKPCIAVAYGLGYEPLASSLALPLHMPRYEPLASSLALPLHNVRPMVRTTCIKPCIAVAYGLGYEPLASSLALPLHMA
ncbi:hypothetical protein NFJ02_28g66430 [Pycnococcus provasolii]